MNLPPVFRRLVWSNLSAQSAEQLSLAASPIVAVVMLGAGAGETGLLQTAQTLPFLLFAIPAGVLADRMSRARLMACAEALRVISLLGILGLLLGGMLNLPLLALLGFVGACGTIAYSVAAPALVPSLVQTEALPTANARIELARTVAFALGPAVAGALIGWLGASVAFGAAVALSASAVLLLSGIREPQRPPVERRHPLAELREGASFVFRHALLAPIFFTQFVFNTAFFTLLAVFVPYAVERLGMSASAVGATLAAYGAGMVAGALGTPRIARVLPVGTVIALGPMAGLTASLLMAATIWAPYPGLAAASFFLIGAGTIVWIVSTTTLRQTVTPRILLGRVSAINIMAYGARPIGAGIGALLGSLYGAESCLVVAAAGFLIQAWMIAASPAVRLRAGTIEAIRQ